MIAENGCPYETYIRLDNKCVDISAQRLYKMATEFDTNAVQEVNQEIEEVSQKLADLSLELAAFCVAKPAETGSQGKIVANICQHQ